MERRAAPADLHAHGLHGAERARAAADRRQRENVRVVGDGVPRRDLAEGGGHIVGTVGGCVGGKGGEGGGQGVGAGGGGVGGGGGGGGWTVSRIAAQCACALAPPRVRSTRWNRIAEGGAAGRSGAAPETLCRIGARRLHGGLQRERGRGVGARRGLLGLVAGRAERVATRASGRGGPEQRGGARDEVGTLHAHPVHAPQQQLHAQRAGRAQPARLRAPAGRASACGAVQGEGRDVSA